MSKNFVICINNEDYPTSLEVRKIYEIIPDPEAEKSNHLRVIDESGEDYLYPKEYFHSVNLPDATEQAITKAA